MVESKEKDGIFKCAKVYKLLKADKMDVISKELEDKMGEFPDVNWSLVVREAVSEEFKRRALLKLLEKIFEKSRMSDKDTIGLGRKLKKAGVEELKSKGLL